MSLEDHVGDILGKARGATGISAKMAAAAAGLGLDAYTRLEREGEVAGEVDYLGLGSALGLHGARLDRIARGWEPAVPDLGRWQHLHQITTVSGMAVSCYLVWDEASREAGLFDTGWDAGPIEALIEHHGLGLRHLFITHGHGDHVAAADAIRTRHPGIELHRGEARGAVIVGGLRVEARPTPGHAADGITYVVTGWPSGAPAVAVVGDALFAGSMGGAGDRLEMARGAVREQVLTLDPAALICPGHGPVTTVGEERGNNPFFG